MSLKEQDKTQSDIDQMGGITPINEKEKNILDIIQKISKFNDKKYFLLKTYPTPKNTKELVEKMEEEGFDVRYAAKIFLKKCNNFDSNNKKHSRFIVLRAGDLGFTDEGSSFSENYNKATEIGLELCTPKEGLELRYVYKKQPLYDSIDIGMEPVEIDSSPHILTIFKNIEYSIIEPSLSISTTKISNEKVYGSGSLFAFRLPYQPL